MNKEFIPYEQALEHKELGFNEPCFGCFLSSLTPSNFTEYHLETEFGMNEGPSDWKNNNFLDKACSAPLYQQAFRWFREKHNLHASIYPIKQHWECDIRYTNKNINSSLFEWDKEFTYEEAELACLKKLIEITKNQQQI